MSTQENVNRPNNKLFDYYFEIPLLDKKVELPEEVCSLHGFGVFPGNYLVIKDSVSSYPDFKFLSISKERDSFMYVGVPNNLEHRVVRSLQPLVLTDDELEYVGVSDGEVLRGINRYGPIRLKLWNPQTHDLFLGESSNYSDHLFL